MKHIIDSYAWRCRVCGEPVSRCLADPMCRPDDGAALIASLAEHLPSDTEPPDADDAANP